MQKKFIILLAISILFSGCGLVYVPLLPKKPSTCGYHIYHDIDFPENTVQLKSYSVVVKPKKEKLIYQYLNKGNYYIHYYHCNGPIDAKLEIKNDQQQLALVNFNLAKKQSVYFTVEEAGNFQLKLNSSSTWTVYFFLLMEIKKNK